MIVHSPGQYLMKRRKHETSVINSKLFYVQAFLTFKHLTNILFLIQYIVFDALKCYIVNENQFLYLIFYYHIFHFVN